MTQAELIAELENLGYEVTSRRLTDWVSKGLLPPLQQRGRGRHRGAAYFWSEPDIVQRAATACDLLSWKYRTEPALLALWLAGYAVDLDRVRGAWLNSLERERADLQRYDDRSYGVEPAYSRWASTFASTWAGKLNLDRVLLTELLVEIFSIIYEPDYPFEPELYEEDFQKAAAAFGRVEKSQMAFVPESSLHTASIIIKRTLTHESVAELIRTTSDTHLEQAQQHWKIFGRTLYCILHRSFPNIFSGQGLSTAKRLAIGFGRTGILTLLYLQRSTRHNNLVEVFDRIEKFVADHQQLFLFTEDLGYNKIDQSTKEDFSSLVNDVFQIGAHLARSFAIKFGE